MEDFLDSFKDEARSLLRNKKHLINILVLGILILAIPLGINLVKQQQIIKSRATVDPIVFIPSSDVYQKANGSWVTKKSQISLQLTSPLGPPPGGTQQSSLQTNPDLAQSKVDAPQSVNQSLQSKVSKNPVVDFISNGFAKTVLAQSPGELCDQYSEGCGNGGTQICYKYYDDNLDCVWDHCDSCQEPTPTDPPPADECTAGDTSGCQQSDGNDCHRPVCNTDIPGGACGFENSPAGTGCSNNGTCDGNGTCNHTPPACGNTCIYSQGSSCYRGNCHDKSQPCSYDVNCWYDPTCSSGTPVTCPPNPPTPTPAAGGCTVSWTIPSNPAAGTSFRVSVRGQSDRSSLWDNVKWKLDSGAWNPITDAVTAGPTFTFTVPYADPNGSPHTLTFSSGNTTRVCTPTGSFTVSGTPPPTGNCPADSNLTISPNPANVGSAITFQYAGGEDTNIGGDTWSGGVPSNCRDTLDLMGRKYTCTAQSAASGAIWKHYWSNGSRCGSATYTINQPNPSITPTPTPTSSPHVTPTPTPSAPPVVTVKFRVAENPTDLQTAGWEDYTTAPMLKNYQFTDITSGPKTIFVQFQDSAGNTTNATNCPKCQVPIKLLGGDPNLASCLLNFQGNDTIINLTGRNFGSDKGSVKSDDNNLQIKTWKDDKIQAVWSNAPVGQQIPISISTPDQQAGNGACSAVSQLSVGAKFFCGGPPPAVVNNVGLVLAGAFPGGTVIKQAVSIDTNGVIQGFNPKLEEGKDYKLSLKVPRSVRKVVPFTAGNGMINVSNLTLPLGDIFPASAPDGSVNDFDHAELVRQWSVAGNASGRTGDLNGDGRVNSIDWACMRYDFGAKEDVEPTPGGTPVPSSTPNPSTTPGASATPTPSPSNTPVATPTSPPTNAPAPASTAPPVPTGLTASCPAPGTTVNLSWGASAGANHYSVYAQTSDHPFDWPGACDYTHGKFCGRIPVSSTSTSFNPTTAGANYTWYVAACAVSDESDSAHTCSITSASFNCAAQ